MNNEFKTAFLSYTKLYNVTRDKEEKERLINIVYKLANKILKLQNEKIEMFNECIVDIEERKRKIYINDFNYENRDINNAYKYLLFIISKVDVEDRKYFINYFIDITKLCYKAYNTKIEKHNECCEYKRALLAY